MKTVNRNVSDIKTGDVTFYDSLVGAGYKKVEKVTPFYVTSSVSGNQVEWIRIHFTDGTNNAKPSTSVLPVKVG